MQKLEVTDKVPQAHEKGHSVRDFARLGPEKLEASWAGALGQQEHDGQLRERVGTLLRRVSTVKGDSTNRRERLGSLDRELNNLSEERQRLDSEIAKLDKKKRPYERFLQKDTIVKGLCGEIDKFLGRYAASADRVAQASTKEEKAQLQRDLNGVVAQWVNWRNEWLGKDPPKALRVGQEFEDVMKEDKKRLIERKEELTITADKYSEEYLSILQERENLQQKKEDLEQKYRRVQEQNKDALPTGSEQRSGGDLSSVREQLQSETLGLGKELNKLRIHMRELDADIKNLEVLDRSYQQLIVQEKAVEQKLQQIDTFVQRRESLAYQIRNNEEIVETLTWRVNNAESLRIDQNAYNRYRQELAEKYSLRGQYQQDGNTLISQWQGWGGNLPDTITIETLENVMAQAYGLPLKEQKQLREAKEKNKEKNREDAERLGKLREEKEGQYRELSQQRQDRNDALAIKQDSLEKMEAQLYGMRSRLEDIEASEASNTKERWELNSEQARLDHEENQIKQIKQDLKEKKEKYDIYESEMSTISTTYDSNVRQHPESALEQRLSGLDKLLEGWKAQFGLSDQYERTIKEKRDKKDYVGVEREISNVMSEQWRGFLNDEKALREREEKLGEARRGYSKENNRLEKEEKVYSDRRNGIAQEIKSIEEQYTKVLDLLERWPGLIDQAGEERGSGVMQPGTAPRKSPTAGFQAKVVQGAQRALEKG